MFYPYFRAIRKLLLFSVILFVTCILIALAIVFEEYFTVGEFFGLHDVMHHGVIEVVIVALGTGVLLSAATFSLYLSTPVIQPVRYQIPVPRTYPLPAHIIQPPWPLTMMGLTVPEQRRRSRVFPY